MKKRFIIDKEAESLWESLEQENIIEVRGGVTDSTLSSDNKSDADKHRPPVLTLAKWILSF